jgi:hypothetical protein
VVVSVAVVAVAGLVSQVDSVDRKLLGHMPGVVGLGGLVVEVEQHWPSPQW